MALPKTKIREILQVKMGGKELSHRDKRQEKIVTFSSLLILSLFVIPAYAFMAIVLPFTPAELAIYSIIITIFGVCAYVFYCRIGLKVPSSDRKNRELASLENNREKEAKDLICEILGNKIYIELNPNLNSLNVYQTNLCKK